MPVPLDILQPAVQQLRGSDGRLSSLAQQSLQQAAAAAQQLAALPGPLAPPAVRQQQERLLAAARQWDPALLQLGSVFDEVGGRCGLACWGRLPGDGMWGPLARRQHACGPSLERLTWASWGAPGRMWVRRRAAAQ